MGGLLFWAGALWSEFHPLPTPHRTRTLTSSTIHHAGVSGTPSLLGTSCFLLLGSASTPDRTATHCCRAFRAGRGSPLRLGSSADLDWFIYPRGRPSTLSHCWRLLKSLSNGESLHKRSLPVSVSPHVRVDAFHALFWGGQMGKTSVAQISGITLRLREVPREPVVGWRRRGAAVSKGSHCLGR